MWKYDTAEQTTRIVRFIPKGTSTHSEYVIFIAYRLEQWLHQGASMLLDKHIA
jgi:hypothetical protein